jgi:hypothetical protein
VLPNVMSTMRFKVPAPCKYFQAFNSSRPASMTSRRDGGAYSIFPHKIAGLKAGQDFIDNLSGEENILVGHAAARPRGKV